MGQNGTKLHLIEPDAIAICKMNMKTTEFAEVDAAQTVRAFAEQEVAEDQERMTGYTIRPDSWVEHTVGGMPAISFIADFENQNKPMVDYRTYVKGDRLVGWFIAACEPTTSNYQDLTRPDHRNPRG